MTKSPGLGLEVTFSALRSISVHNLTTCWIAARVEMRFGDNPCDDLCSALGVGLPVRQEGFVIEVIIPTGVLHWTRIDNGDATFPAGFIPGGMADERPATWR